MKSPATLLIVFALTTTLHAEGPYNEFDPPDAFPCANGNILFTNVGNYPVTPCKWIKLSTNSNYMVVCQIAYEDSSFDAGPSTPEEIMKSQRVESCLNLALLKFLQMNFSGETEAQLLRDYRAGNVRAKIENDFALWFDKNVVDTLRERRHNSLSGSLAALFYKCLGTSDNYEPPTLDLVTIHKVSMRAVGPFASALDEL